MLGLVGGGGDDGHFYINLTFRVLATFSKATITESDKGSGNEFRDVQLQLE